LQSWRLHDGAADLVTYEQLKRIGDWQLTEEAQRSALAELVSAIADLDTSSRWGEGRTAASDGQRFSLPRRVLQQTYSTRFSDFALEFYTFVADNYAPFHSLPIECTDRDAAFVLDGLLYNESELEIEEHYTDTHGYTEISFAPFAMPGLRFCPRIRGVQHRRIYRINPNCDYGLLTSLVSRSDQTIDTAQIAEQWDRMGQLYASLKTGNVTASVALKLKKQRLYRPSNGEQYPNLQAILVRPDQLGDHRTAVAKEHTALPIRNYAYGSLLGSRLGSSWETSYLRTGAAKNMSFPHPIRSLAQLPDLSCLSEICREYNVEITAFGSLVRRLARALVESEDTPDKPLPDLFELVPFLSDIDLRHSGKATRTAEIRRAILGQVPFSECFRWEILSEEELRRFTDDEVHLPVIPVNKLTLGTRAGNGIQDPFNGYKDLQSRKYHFMRSPFRYRSSLIRDYKESEFLSLLHYLRILCEEPKPTMDQPGWEAIQEIARDIQTQAILGALEESAYLRARFRYRSQALRASCRDEAFWQELTGQSGIGEAIEFINRRLPIYVLDMTSSERQDEEKIMLSDLIASSCRLVGDRFRVHDTPLDEPKYENAERAWMQVSQSRQPLELVSDHALPRLAEGQRIVADAPEFRFYPGKAPSAFGDEHLHFQILLPPEHAKLCREHGETKLAAFLLLTEEQKAINGELTLRSFALPLPTVCGLLESRKLDGTVQTCLQIRANCGRMLETFPELLWENRPGETSACRLKLFVVGLS
jgi:Tn3 transposase DDE domain